MPVLALALYGSRARGDQDPSSDTDILLITDDKYPHHIAAGNLSMSYYPVHDLKERARTGDLFLYHVLFEGRPLYDPENYFSKMKKTYKLRSSYQNEMSHASDLGWFIVQRGDELSNTVSLSRKVTWVVRTILIAASAERGQPVFSHARLLESAPKPETSRLLAQKMAAKITRHTRNDLRTFLREYGLPNPVGKDAPVADYIARFADTENKVALRLVTEKALVTDAYD